MQKYDAEREARTMVLMGMCTGDAAHAIEAGEARGQSDLINSADLPIDQNHGPSLDQITAGTGIVFGERVDDMFISATLPKGWEKRRTDHSMWSDLLDEHGRVRAIIFYKASNYDRSAHMDWLTFLFVDRQVVDSQGRVKYESEDFDRASAMYQAWVADRDGHGHFHAADVPDSLSVSDDREEYGRRSNLERQAKAECEAWLDQNRPEWRDVFAYWNETPPAQPLSDER